MQITLKWMSIGAVVTAFITAGTLSTRGQLTQKPIKPQNGVGRSSIPKEASHKAPGLALKYMTLGLPSNSVRVDDPLQVQATSNVNGRLAYTYNILPKDYKKTGFPTFLVVRQIFSANPGHSILGASQTYSVNKVEKGNTNAKYDVIFDPLFSSDGRYILFKFGDTDTNGAFHPHVLDTQTNELNLISDKDLLCRQVSWSPDGNYITTIDGGFDADGHTVEVRPEGEFHSVPLHLYMSDWKIHQEHLVVQNDTVLNSFAWIAPHTLICGLLPLRDQEVLQRVWRSKQIDQLSTSKSKLPTNSKSGNIARPNIYTYSVETGKITLLIKDGYRPTPSPDGKWIAFFGSEDPHNPLPLKEDWTEQANGSYLTIAELDGSNRTILNLEKGSYSHIIWEPDNRHLLAVEEKGSGINSQSQITEWDIITKRFRPVALLKAKELKPQVVGFKPLKLSADGASLFMVGASFLPEPYSDINGYYMTQNDSLLVLDIKTGTVSPVAHLKNDWGLSWHPD